VSAWAISAPHPQGDSTLAHVTAPDRAAAIAVGQEVKTLTGGQALVEMLKRQGVDTIFALPGVQLDGLFSALYDARSDFRIIHTRHEQATSYMADGYSRSTGKIGTCLVVPGPGLMNAMAGLATAYANNSSVLCLSSTIHSTMIEFGRGLLHEVPNQLGMVRSATKYAARAMTPQEIPAVFTDVVGHLLSGRPRPVEMEVPPDILFASGDVSLLPGVAAPERSAGDPDTLSKIAKLLGNAKSPLTIAGGGVIRSEAWRELLALAEMLQAPVVHTASGKGAVSDRHYLAQGELAEPTLVPKADVILGVGTRFVKGTGSALRPFTPEQTLIQIDIDEEEIGRNYANMIGLHADAKAALAKLVDLTASQNIHRDSREDELTAVKQAATAQANAVQPQSTYALAIRAELPDDGIAIEEKTQVAYWSDVGFPVYKPRTYITSGYQGTLGFGFTTALGVKVGNPDVPVVSINGDGGFGFTLNELSTAVQHNIAAVTIVFNDNAYGNVKRIQQEDLGGKVIASDLLNPDYMKLGDAFGIRTYRVETPDALRTALRESFNANEPTLIEVPVGPMPNHWKVLGLR
jgi:acetolactate synthase-1/2/3 large subunit